MKQDLTQEPSKPVPPTRRGNKDTGQYFTSEGPGEQVTVIRNAYGFPVIETADGTKIIKRRR